MAEAAQGARENREKLREKCRRQKYKEREQLKTFYYSVLVWICT
jgi:hypothetical protein